MKAEKTQACQAALPGLPGRRIPNGLLVLIAALLLAACAVDPGQGDLALTPETAVPAVPTTAAPAAAETVTPDGTAPTRALPGGLETVPPTPGARVEGEVPDDLMQRVIDDLAGRLGVDPQSIQVVEAGAVLWNDGSLGCPEPGQVYTQAQVQGYQIILQVGDQSYDYRANEGSYFFLCEQELR